MKKKFKTKQILNHRKGATTDDQIIQTIEKGKTVVWYGYSSITSNGTEWKLVEYNNRLGFCNAKYLKAV